jgi:ATP-dependent Clp protease adaptor protein ClpS
MSTRRKDQHDSQVLTRTKTREKHKQPRLFRVLFHNDDYTPMEFVVGLLEQIFHLSENDATRIMLHVHNRGIGVAGVFPYSVAETRVAETSAAAEKAGYPLLCTMEPATGGSDSGDDDAGKGDEDGSTS